MIIFKEKLMDDITANRVKCENYIEGSLAMCTSLAPIIGYDTASEIAHEAFKTGKTIREIVLEKKLLDKKIIDKILNPKNMLEPK